MDEKTVDEILGGLGGDPSQEALDEAYVIVMDPDRLEAQKQRRADLIKQIFSD